MAAGAARNLSDATVMVPCNIAAECGS